MNDPLASHVPVAGPDAEILRYLTQVVAIGQHKQAWDSAAVVRVAEAHLNHPHTLRRQLLNERAARGRVEDELSQLRATVARLQAQPWEPKIVTAPTRVVELPPRLARVLDYVTTGACNETIAAELGTSAGTVANNVGNLMKALGVKTRIEIVILILTGQVEVKVAAARNQAA